MKVEWSIYRTDVVPRKGDVDRNEIGRGHPESGLVVPRKGDVDRNMVQDDDGSYYYSRPPQGGRG